MSLCFKVIKITKKGDKIEAGHPTVSPLLTFYIRKLRMATQSPSPLRGHVGNLSSEEDETLSKMKEKAKTLGPKLEEDNIEIDDAMLLRFLRARNFDINLSFPMLQDCWEWRRSFQGVGAANVTEESIQNELKSDKGFFYKHDKEDRPVFYVRVRLHDSNSRNLEECQRFCIYNMERGRNMMKPPGETVCLIFDLGGFSMKNMVSSSIFGFIFIFLIFSFFFSSHSHSLQTHLHLLFFLPLPLLLRTINL
jgi:hypothetical protein